MVGQSRHVADRERVPPPPGYPAPRRVQPVSFAFGDTTIAGLAVRPPAVLRATGYDWSSPGDCRLQRYRTRLTCASPSPPGGSAGQYWRLFSQFRRLTQDLCHLRKYIGSIPLMPPDVERDAGE